MNSSVSPDVSPERVDAVRAFNRFYTNLVGVLGEGLLETPYSLTEARVIFELAQSDVTEVAALRRSLGLDAGYLSRILSRFESDGLVRRERSAADARRQVAGLTDRGRAVFRELDARSGDQINGMLGRLPEAQQRRLVGAMEAIGSILGERPSPEMYVLRAPGPGDYGWVVQRHGALYASEYGWDATFEVLVARLVADFAESGRGEAWIAEVDGEPAGCVFCVPEDERTARLRLLLVEPWARGLGIGGRLVEECVRYARRSGHEELVLWTNDVLVAARRIYQRAGFERVEAEPHHSFGHDLVGETWRLKL
jgi:DNA-binding MarR family transcriptional regulator/GNAT superfamily N-acetyltransferase